MSAKYLVSFDGAKICYDPQIKNPNDYVFLLIHGLGGNLESWAKIRSVMEKGGLSTVALDLRGHGYSSRSKKADYYKFSNFSKDIAKLIEEEKIKKPVLVGHCFGGMVALSTERDFPDLAAAMILIATGDKVPSFAKIARLGRLEQGILHLVASCFPDYYIRDYRDSRKYRYMYDFDYRRIISDILHVSVRGYLFIVEKLLGYDVEGILGEINIPVLIIEGEDDSIFPPKVGRHLKEKISRSKLVDIPGANHILVYNNPDEVAAEIVQFATELVRN